MSTAGRGRAVLKSVRGLLAGIVVVGSLSLAPAAAAQRVGGSQTETFHYVGHANQTVVVPSWAVVGELRVVGARGGAVGRIAGGAGAEVKGVLAVRAGEILTLTVAGRGGEWNVNRRGDGGWGWGRGGSGGQEGPDGYGGAGGGGASAVAVSSCQTSRRSAALTASTVLRSTRRRLRRCVSSVVAIAGGGGGAGGNYSYGVYQPGGAGGSSGASADHGGNGGGADGGLGGVGGATGWAHGGVGGPTRIGYSGAGGGGGGAGNLGGSGGGGGGLAGGGGGGGAGSSHHASELRAASAVRGGTSDGDGLIQITWHPRVPAPMTLTADRTHLELGQAPVLTVHMPVLASGIVGFYDQAQPGSDKGIGTAPIIDGVATLTTPTRPLVKGDNPIHASYGGNASYAANDSNTVTVAVGKPSMRLTAHPIRIEPRQAPALIVQMPLDATGMVGFYDQAQPGTDKGIGVAPIVRGLAMLTTPTRPLPAGDNAIHASYGGDSQYAANDSNTATVSVSKPRAAMRLSAYPTRVGPGHAPVLVVHMPLDATGEVGFYDQAQPGTDKGIGVAHIVHGLASLTTPHRPLVPGENPIHASYLGNTRYAANDSNTVTVAVQTTVRLGGGPVSETFHYVGRVDQSVAVPTGAVWAQLRVVGGRGAVAARIPGGDGAEVTGILPVGAGEILTLKVASRGASSGNGGWGWSEGGNGGSAHGTHQAGGGGGSSSVAITRCSGCASTPGVIAAGGGGAGGSGFAQPIDDGGAGGSSGAAADPGHDGKGPGAGRGGAGAGSGAPGGAGSGNAPLPSGGGGGGGGGYVGGGGGGTGGGGGGGGGGASSHYTRALQDHSLVRGSTSDGNGLIQITWHGRRPAPMTLTADLAKIEPNQRTVLAVHMPVLATGIIGFYDQAQPGTDKGIGTAPIIDGVATLATPTRPLLPGDNTIHASYLGNTQYAANDSNTVIVAIRKPPAAMRLTAYPTHIEPGQAPALIVEMPFDATGEIGFYDQAQPGTDKGIGVARIVHGLAILTTPYRPLPPGDNLIHASYLGDERYADNDSNTVTVRLSQPMRR